MPIPESLPSLRSAVRALYIPNEADSVKRLIGISSLSAADRQAISRQAAELVRRLRASTSPNLMEVFLSEYSLSTEEGVALMCLAEALLRVPDTATIDALIEDKIVAADWGRHLNNSSSSLVNASTWALMLTGKVLSREEDKSVVSTVHSVVRRLGEPVVRTAVAEAMKELGRQFVLGRTIKEGMARAAKMEAQGYSYSYDMLGEAARTAADAKRYHLAYSDAITAIAPKCRGGSIRMNPGISVKLSALYPRYEIAQRERVMTHLAPRALSLAQLAASADMGFNIDAEEAERLDLSLDVIERILSDPTLEGWDGFGVVVQAYGPRALAVIDWLYALAQKYERRIMVRLVKGAYWDTEIKRAQVLGLDGFPVFTRKFNTDVSYIACAGKLLGMTDRIYPQFATHNAHTLAAVLNLAGAERDRFEFQRLHGMGEEMHQAVMKANGTKCRIYAPVGAHADLLAYLVRRLLENGANSSFVNQIVDKSIPPEDVAADPFDLAAAFCAELSNPAIRRPAALYGPGRRNAKGWDLSDPTTLAGLEADRGAFRETVWTAEPGFSGPHESISIFNPARPDDLVGTAAQADAKDVAEALQRAQGGFAKWSAVPVGERAGILRRAADLYETHAAEFFALAAREAGKTLSDGVAEVREAVDFLRYYANEAERLEPEAQPRGVIACISPWNFPLAIFTGQIAAALAAGNAVIAKPAEQTPLIAARAVALLREAGLPVDALHLLPGDGPAVGGPLLGDARVAGVCFTGSTQTAKIIDRQMAEALAPDAPLIAETGGLNAMIVDSSALPEQVVRDIVQSAFQSAGQRCSALRILYVQEDVAERVLEMLCGAMETLRLGDPWLLSSDIGPVIDVEAHRELTAYSRRMEVDGRLIRKLATPAAGLFVAPAIFRVSGIEELEREIFGPILHVATFGAQEIDAVVDAINARGYGLTFGVHTRVDDRVQQIVDRIAAGNIYVNRNQIGAIVGSQPFGGEGLSGTGPKAGGPFYVERFTTRRKQKPAGQSSSGGRPKDGVISPAQLQAAFDALAKRKSKAGEAAQTGAETLAGGLGVALDSRIEALRPYRGVGHALPGPTGESNRLSLHPRGAVLCFGQDAGAVLQQTLTALALGNSVVAVLPTQAGFADMRKAFEESGLAVQILQGQVDPDDLATLRGVDAVAVALPDDALAAVRRALARRDGPILAPITPMDSPIRLMSERHVCVDTTAAGGNASLMTAADA